ncbi:MAG TPA: DUF4159 domain-containing protein [Microthrixaceae bacterium]|nr:DUF4159 domain-containing protein [Microthrixaceae bacterium]
MSKPFTFATGIYTSGDWESASLVPQNVIDVLAKYTTLELNPSGVNVRIDSPEVFEYPFLFLTGHLPVFFTPRERANLKRYVERGGFLFVDDHNHDIDGIFHQTMTRELEQLFGPLKKIPNDHRIYSAFFEFPDGPPTTSHELNGWGDNLVHDYLMGIMDGDRIDVLYSNKDYSSEWHVKLTDNRDRREDEDPAKIAVNFVVYALTR